MRRRSTVTGRLDKAERLDASSAGNPRWEVTVDGKKYRTEVNGSVGYDVDNHRVGRRVTLTLEGTSVVYMEAAS